MPEFVENPAKDAISNPALKEFYEVWASLQGPDGRARRDELFLERLEDHVSYMTIIEWLQDEERYHVRFSGVDFVVGLGADRTGAFADEADNIEETLARLDRLRKTGIPYLVTNSSLSWDVEEPRHYDSLVCPLYKEDGQFDSILFRVAFRPDEERHVATAVAP